MRRALRDRLGFMPVWLCGQGETRCVFYVAFAQLHRPNPIVNDRPAGRLLFDITAFALLYFECFMASLGRGNRTGSTKYRLLRFNDGGEKQIPLTLTSACARQKVTRWWEKVPGAVQYTSRCLSTSLFVLPSSSFLYRPYFLYSSFFRFPFLSFVLLFSQYNRPASTGSLLLLYIYFAFFPFFFTVPY